MWRSSLKFTMNLAEFIAIWLKLSYVESTGRTEEGKCPSTHKQQFCTPSNWIVLLNLESEASTLINLHFTGPLFLVRPPLTPSEWLEFRDFDPGHESEDDHSCVLLQRREGQKCSGEGAEWLMWRRGMEAREATSVAKTLNELFHTVCWTFYHEVIGWWTVVLTVDRKWISDVGQLIICLYLCVGVYVFLLFDC